MIQEELLQEAGGTWTVDEVAEHLGIARRVVQQRRRRGTLLAVEVTGVYRYPRCQFRDSGTVPGLAAVLRAIETESAWVRLSVLLSPTLRSDLDPDATADEELTIIEALTAGRREEALHAARSWGHQGRT